MAKRFTPGRMKNFASMPSAIPPIYPPNTGGGCKPLTGRLVLQSETTAGSNTEPVAPSDAGYMDWKIPVSYATTSESSDNSLFLLSGAGTCRGVQKTIIFSSGTAGPAPYPIAEIKGDFPNGMNYLIMFTGSAAELIWTIPPGPMGIAGAYWATDIMPSGCYGWDIADCAAACDGSPKSYLTASLT